MSARKLPQWSGDQPDRVMRSRTGWPFFHPLYRASGEDEPLAFPQEGELRAGGVSAQNTFLLKLTGWAMAGSDNRTCEIQVC